MAKRKNSVTMEELAESFSKLNADQIDEILEGSWGFAGKTMINADKIESSKISHSLSSFFLFSPTVCDIGTICLERR